VIISPTLTDTTLGEKQPPDSSHPGAPEPATGVMVTSANAEGIEITKSNVNKDRMILNCTFQLCVLS